jgi:hypothetical protein
MPQPYKLGPGTMVRTTTADGETSFTYSPDAPLGTLSVAAQQYRAWLDQGNTPDPADPRPVVYSGTLAADVRVRTTDATPAEVYRRTLAPLTGYAAVLNLLGVDAGNGAVRMIRASIVAKRIGAGAVLVGAPVVIANHADAGATTWAIAATASGNDFVVTVTGATGRTIDWLLSGGIRSFTPGGA